MFTGAAAAPALVPDVCPDVTSQPIASVACIRAPTTPTDIKIVIFFMSVTLFQTYISTIVTIAILKFVYF